MVGVRQQAVTGVAGGPLGSSALRLGEPWGLGHHQESPADPWARSRVSEPRASSGCPLPQALEEMLAGTGGCLDSGFVSCHLQGTAVLRAGRRGKNSIVICLWV